MTDLLRFLEIEDLRVLGRLREHGDAWIVGGWVRNGLSGDGGGDIDIATTLRPEEVLEIFPRSLDIGVKFGTIGVRLDSPYDGEKIWEVTTLRKDGGYGDGRRPDNVTFGGDITGDLSRRDFTINSMALDSDGGLIDPFDGVKDLEMGIIRAVGNAKDRIAEDGLRILRAYRFLLSHSNERRLDPDLLSAISNNLDMLDGVSRERVWGELKLILSSKGCLEIIRGMVDSGVLGAILPNLEVNLNVQMCGNYIVNLALICSNDDRNGEELALFLKNVLKTSNDEVGLICFLHDLMGATLDSHDASIRRFKVVIPESRQRKFLEYRKGRGDDVSNFSVALDSMADLRSGNAPLVNGIMLAESTGIEPGKKLGRLKAWLHRIQVEEDLESSDEVIELLNSLPWRDGGEEKWPSISWP